MVPENLIIGIGAGGMMRVSEGVMELCKKRGIIVEIDNTAESVKEFNNAEEGKVLSHVST